MFFEVRYQTGEVQDIINEMKSGKIPVMDVMDMDDFDHFVESLSQHGIYKVEGFPYNKNARNRVAEPEFEFRAAFYTKPVSTSQVDPKDLMYIDVYFEPDIEETYDNVFGD